MATTLINTRYSGIVFQISIPLGKSTWTMHVAGRRTIPVARWPSSFAPCRIGYRNHATPRDRCETPIARVPQRVVPANSSIVQAAVSHQMPQEPSLPAIPRFFVKGAEHAGPLVSTRYSNSGQQLWGTHSLLRRFQTRFSTCPRQLICV